MSGVNIEELVTQRFLKNMDYFSQKQPRVYEKLIAFENAVANGHYQEKYELEYKDEGYFDVREKSTGNYLYGMDSNKYAKDIAKSIDFRKEDNIFMLSPKRRFTKEVLDGYKGHDITSNSLYGVANIINYINKKMPKEELAKKWYKFAFFGVGLGVHIEEADKKLDSDFYLFVEDDLELFRLSLFIVDYAKLANKSELYFVVFDEDDVAREIYEDFLEDGFMFNNYLKFIHTLHMNDKMLKLFHEIMSSQNYQLFPYHAFFNKFLRALEFMEDGYRFINLKPSVSILEDTPLLIIGAGPSLSRELRFVKKHQDDFTIISVTAALKTLQKEGIVPDIVVHLDPFEDANRAHFEGLKDEYFKKPLALFAAQSPMEIVKKFDKDKVFIFENGTKYKIGFSTVESPCVGSISYAIAVSLGANEIYLLGLDLAVDPETKMTHSSEHIHAKELSAENIDKMEQIFSFGKSLIRTQGNFRDGTYTTAAFLSSIKAFERNSRIHKVDSAKVYNLSDGAKLYDTIPLRVEEYKKSKKVPVKGKELKELFVSISTDKISSDEHQNIEQMLFYTRQIKKILKAHRSKKYTTVEEYQYALMDLSLKITKANSYTEGLLSLIFLRYMQYIYPYIFDFLNTRNIKSVKNDIVVVDKMFITKLKEIADAFEMRLERFFQKEIA